MKIQFWKSLLIGISLVLVSSIGLSSAMAQVDRFVATDGTDVGDCTDPNNPCLTVNYAAQTNGQDGDTIFIEAGTYNETTETIISGIQLTIIGEGANNTFIDGGNNIRLFSILVDANVSILNVTIQNGDVDASGQGGGGILNQGTLSLQEVVVKNNTVGQDGQGGGIGNVGNLAIWNSTISGNEAPRNGGGISNGGGKVDGSNSAGTLTMVNSTISGNTVTDGGGGGIYNESCDAMDPCDTVETDSTAELFNVTIASNTSNDAGAGEQAEGGGGINVLSGTVNINNSILGNNTDNSSENANDCFGTLESTHGYNLVEDTNGCTLDPNTTGNITGEDPQLDPLTNNGGETPTHALQDDSPAIDAGDPNGCKDDNGTNLDEDQRESTRPLPKFVGDTPICDMGAYEAASQANGGGGNGDNGGGCSFAGPAAFSAPALAGYLALLFGNLGLLGWFRRRK